MQVQKIQNNNYNTIRYQSTNTKNVSFGERLIFDPKFINRLSAGEKSELALLKRLFKRYGQPGDIRIKNDKNVSVQNVIDDLRSKYSEVESQYILSRKVEDAFGDSRVL